MKVVREYTFEGPEEWLRVTLAKSLQEGEQDFLKNTAKKITVRTIYNDLEKVPKKDQP